MNIPEKAKKIFSIYRKLEIPSNLIFPYLGNTDLKNQEEVSVRTQSVTRNLNRALKRASIQVGIKKKI